MNIYDFTVKKQNGEEVDLESFRGKVILVVNTATGCGFTPQYKAWKFLISLAISLQIRHPEKIRRSMISAPVAMESPSHSITRSMSTAKTLSPCIGGLRRIQNFRALTVPQSCFLLRS